MRATCLLLLLIVHTRPCGAAEPTREQAIAALKKAVTFFRVEVSRHSGYVWNYSADLKLREGEGVAANHTIWVQPPGTPTIGEAFLDAFEAVGDESFLKAARRVGNALLFGQLHSGGWGYSITFDPLLRKRTNYRFDLEGNETRDPVGENAKRAATGWADWKRRRFKGNVSTLDDDTTQAALRFLMRLDQVNRKHHYADRHLKAGIETALTAMLRTQYPNGGHSANFDRLQVAAPSAKDYPVKSAGYPENWSKTWPKTFRGCYVLNDEIAARNIDTFLLAWEVYGDEKYRIAAEKVGEFLILAQMPDPQPAWAQQYAADMTPCWSRAFEPPAVTGGESQGAMRALMTLARRTGNKKFLKPIPRAIAFLRKSALPDGRLARFYELKTNRPIYFTRINRRHTLTYSNKNIAKGYGYIIENRLDSIEREYKRLLKAQLPEKQAPEKLGSGLRKKAAAIIAALDERGAWAEPGRLRHHKITPKGGVISCATFASNVRTLSRFVIATRPRK